MVSPATESALVKPRCHEYTKRMSPRSRLSFASLVEELSHIFGGIFEKFASVVFIFDKQRPCLPLIGVKKSRFQIVTY